MPQWKEHLPCKYTNCTICSSADIQYVTQTKAPDVDALNKYLRFNWNKRLDTMSFTMLLANIVDYATEIWSSFSWDYIKNCITFVAHLIKDKIQIIAICLQLAQFFVKSKHSMQPFPYHFVAILFNSFAFHHSLTPRIHPINKHCKHYFVINWSYLVFAMRYKMKLNYHCNKQVKKPAENNSFQILVEPSTSYNRTIKRE